MYDIKVFENLLSSVRVEREEPAFQEISTTGTRFRKPAFLVPKKRRLHVDGRLTRRKKSPISKISEYVWTGPIVSKTKIIVLPFSCFFTNQSKINVTSKQNLSKNKRTQSIQIFD